jgi:hypothetical protein
VGEGYVFENWLRFLKNYIDWWRREYIILNKLVNLPCNYSRLLLERLACLNTWYLCNRGCTRTFINIKSWKHYWSYMELQVDTWQSCHSKAIAIEWWSLTSIGFVESSITCSLKTTANVDESYDNDNSGKKESLI